MCLAKPFRLIETDTGGSNGIVDTDFGTLKIRLDLVPEARTGDYVLVHAGMAIELLEDEDAQAILESFENFVFNADQFTPGEINRS